MSINAATSSTSQVSSSSSSSQVNSASNSDNAKKSTTDSSFKDEMNKVASSENKKDEKGVEKTDTKVNAASEKENQAGEQKDTNTLQNQSSEFNTMLEGSADYSKFASMAMMDVNSMLQNDIQQMANLEIQSNREIQSVNAAEMTLSAQKSSDSLFTNSISMTQSDADFFVNLTQNNDVSVQNITAQAQNLVNQGAEVKEVKQNMQISETLLNAINTAKENNQPLRIDFDQNVSVILRVNKDGVISANFIPGDKAVEQYLKNNIDSLKATFNENELPYSDLSYSNRGRQQQKENRRNNK